jgi:predicted AAA+ superfamily ATPase
MDFEEFLWAKGYDDSTISSLLSHMIEMKPFNELEMDIFHALFLDFAILGGMPAVVKDYIEKNVTTLATTKNEYEYHVEVAAERGGEYRKINVEFIIMDAFPAK